MIWKPAPVDPQLRQMEAHIWCFHLGDWQEQHDRLFHLTALDEKERANRLRFERDRRGFIIRRGLMRLILGRYLKQAAQDLRFGVDDLNKPYLVNSPGLAFNSSHSSDLGLLVVIPGAAVGIDVEKIRFDIDPIALSERFYSPMERVELASLSPEEQRIGFFLAWTRKEAYLKALGSGLALPLDNFSVSLTPGEPALLIEARGGLPAPDRFHLYHLEPGDGYVGAACLPAEEWEPNLWRVEPSWLSG